MAPKRVIRGFPEALAAQKGDRLSKWVNGWLLGKHGLSGAGKELISSLDPRTKEGKIGLLGMLAGGRRPQAEIGPLYHGTPVSYNKFNIQRTSPEGLFGRGIYLTDSPKVANSYSEKIQRAQDLAVVHGLPKTIWFGRKEDALAHIAEKPSHRRAVGDSSSLNNLTDEDFQYANHPGGHYGVHEFNHPLPKIAPNIHVVSMHPSRMLKMDDPIDPHLVDAAIDYAKKTQYGKQYLSGEYTVSDLEDYLMYGPRYGFRSFPKTPSDLYTRLDQEIGWKADTNKFLRKLGYDALHYQGGKRIGGLGEHNAYVALKPDILKPYYRK